MGNTSHPSCEGRESSWFLEKTGNNQQKEKREGGMKKILAISILIAALMIAGVGACGKSTTTDGAYKLTHSAADVEHILGWDFIISQCPDIGEYEKVEGFVHRGQTMQLTTGETFSIDEDSPAAWSSTRFVRTEWEGGRFRSFGVGIGFCETAEDLDELVDELLQEQGFWESVQTEGDFMTAVHETETPMQTIQLFLAGKHFLVLIQEFASSDESLFFDKNALTELRSIAQGKISMSELTPLPPEIPGRRLK